MSELYDRIISNEIKMKVGWPPAHACRPCKLQACMYMRHALAWLACAVARPPAFQRAAQARSMQIHTSSMQLDGAGLDYNQWSSKAPYKPH